MISSLAALFALVWASTLLATSAAAVGRVRARGQRQAARTNDEGPLAIILVRPVSGADTWLESALSSVPAGLERHAVRIRLAVTDVEDAAYPSAVRATAALVAAGWSATLCLTAARGQNRKAAQLAAVLSTEPPAADPTREIVIVADADVDLAASPLRELLAPFADPGIGAVWAPPVERAPALTLADRASQALLGGSLHAFPLLARLDEGGLVGKLCALRRSALETIGGFETLVPWLGEDMRLAALLGAADLAFVSTTRPAISVANGRSSEAVLSRYTRWLAVIRAQRPWLLLSYPALFFGTFPAVALCLGLALAGSSPWLLAVASALLLGRIVVARTAARAAGRPGSLGTALADAVLADVLLCCAFFLATTRRHVAWKDNRFTFDRRGMLQEAEEVPRAIA